MSVDPSSAPGRFITLGQYKVHYELIGEGKEVLFLIPGGMGSTRTHFSPQLENFDRNKLTILAWDPPGFGYSGPPDHSGYTDSYQRDSKVAVELIKALKFEKVSVLGWCGGAMTAIVTAAQNPNLVHKLILVSAWGYLDENLVRRWNVFRNVASWAPQMRDSLIKLYGINFVQSRWNQRLAVFDKMRQKTDNGEICKNDLKAIQCQTLLIHSKDDAWVPIQKSQYLINHIKNSRLIEFEDGNHYPHLSHSLQFNRLVEEFINN